MIMKKIRFFIVLALCIIAGNATIKAQDSVYVSIDKVTEKGKEYIDVTIKNENSGDIVIHTGACWDDQGFYSTNPVSYLKFIANPLNTSSKETDKLVLSKKKISNFQHCLNPYVEIKAGQSYSIKYLLYEEDISPYKAFSDEEKDKIENLQAQLRISYSYMTDDEKLRSYNKNIKSNELKIQK